MKGSDGQIISRPRLIHSPCASSAGRGLMRSLIIFNQRRSIISWLTPPLHHHSSPLLSPRPRPPFTSHSIFSSHCPGLHAPSELHYFFPLAAERRGTTICYRVSTNKNISPVAKIQRSFCFFFPFCTFRRRLWLGSTVPLTDPLAFPVTLCVFLFSTEYKKQESFIQLIS